MSKILTKGDVIKVANLAHLKLTSGEIDNFVEEINEILKYVKQLQSADVKNLKPTDQVSGLSNVWREDKVIDYGYKAADLLKNVPKLSDDNHIKVNRMV